MFSRILYSRIWGDNLIPLKCYSQRLILSNKITSCTYKPVNYSKFAANIIRATKYSTKITIAFSLLLTLAQHKQII